jgi:hypothetical protein
MRTTLLPTVLLVLGGCAGDDLLLPDGVPSQLRVVSGDGQSAKAGDAVRHPLVVEALDRAGRPVPGAAVIFEFVDPARGAEISAANTQTDLSGRASAEVTLGDAVGDQPVVARLADPDLQVQFLLTAIQRDGGGGGGNDDDGDDNDGNGGGGGGGGGAGPAPPPAPAPPADEGGDDGGKGKGKDHDKGKGKGKDDHGKGSDLRIAAADPPRSG